MTAHPSGSHETLRSRRGPRYRTSGESSLTDTESIRELREHTTGLSSRMHLPSLEAMRAGTVLSPQGAVRRYLISARTAGLPKAWAMRLVVWAQRQVDSLWPMEQTSLRTLEEKAMQAEHVDDVMEKRNDLEHTAITLRERIQSLTTEIVADQLCLARLEREMESVQ